MLFRSVEWLQSHDPAAIPRTRVQMVEQEPRKKAKVVEKTHTDQVGLFTGSPEAEERATQLTSAIPIIDDASAERDRAERSR